jgi:hypothetical protein
MTIRIQYFRRLFVFIALSVFSSSCSSQSQNNIILEDGLYFNGKTFIPFKEITIKDGKILAIRNSMTKESGQRIPLAGKYIIPGLVDAHAHIAASPTYPPVMAEPADNLKSNLHCGVTTVIDLFYAENGFKQLKQRVDPSPELYASVLMAGPILTAPGGHGTEYGVPTRTISTVEEAGKITTEVIDNGVDLIKVVYQAYSNPHSLNKDMLKKIVL